VAGSAAVKALRAGLAVDARMRGGSMWPLLRTGDWIRIEPTMTASLSRGDIAVVHDERGVVAHRVVSVEPLILRGDRLAANDPPYDPSALVGRVRALRRGPLAIDLDGVLGGALSRLSAIVGRYVTRAADAAVFRRVARRSGPCRRLRPDRGPSD